MRTCLLSLSLLLPSLALAGDPGALQRFDANVQRGHHAFSGSLSVRLAPGVSMQDLQALDARCVPDHRWGRRDWVSLDCDPSVPPRELITHWARLDAVTVVQAPFEVRLLARPDDLATTQWHLNNTGQRIQGTAGVSGADIGAVDAWDITTGSNQTVVAVIDTGVWVDHNELAGRIHQPAGEICDNGTDDDGNGYIDDCTGWDVGDGDNDPDPRDLPSTSSTGRNCAPFHGTFIAGQVAPVTDNGSGLAGVLWDGRILPIKMASDEDCRLTDTMVAEAVFYALDQEAAVINASWTLGNMSTPALNEAMVAISASDTLLVIAAGNANRDADAELSYPIDYNVKDDIVVAATDNRDRRAGFSNWGEVGVDLAAPGRSIRSLNIGGPDQQVWSNGTSFAAPLVAAGAALIWDRYPYLRRAEVRASLLDGVQPIPGLDCANATRCVATGGRLDLPGALDEADYWATTPFPSADLVVDDAVGGDGDDVIERGEQPSLQLLLSNRGHVDTNELSATLVLDHPHATVRVSELAVRPAAANTADTASGVAFQLDVPLACVADVDATVRVDLSDTLTGEVWTGQSFTLPVLCDIDEDGDGVRYGEDCDDEDPDVRPGADELCNARDDDCDGTVDEDDAVDAGTWYPDADGDGFGIDGDAVRACAPPNGYGEGIEDCDDDDATAFPGGEEVCDQADNDCNGLVDDEASDASVFYADDDGDGWGGDEVAACEQGSLVTRPGDCDDQDAEAYPDSRTRRTDCSEKVMLLGCACDGGHTGGGLAVLPLVLLAMLRRRRRGSL